MEKAIFISVVNDYTLYDQCVRHNPCVQGNPAICCTPLDNTQEDLPATYRYNCFLNHYISDEETWFVFCHNDWEIKEDIIPKLALLDKKKLYGPIGAKLYTTKFGNSIHEVCGACYEKKRDGTNERIQKGKRKETATTVDSFDSQCLIAHSSLVKKYKLRFDENLSFALYVEDFCFHARLNHGIESNILQLDCCHWSQHKPLSECSPYTEALAYLDNKYKQQQLAGTRFLIGEAKRFSYKSIPSEKIEVNQAKRYSHCVDLQNDNNAQALIGHHYVTAGATVLDVGCACGDLGEALHRHKQVTVYGMEYNQESIQVALQTNAFKHIHRVDLNNFLPEEFQQYYGKFDYIIFSDVLEHILEPQKILNAFKVFLNEKGAFLISFPNIAHASIKMNLLLDDWTYTDIGLLDKTHIKFFTRKSIPTFLAEINLKIIEMKYTVVDRQGSQPTTPWKELPPYVLRSIYKNPHSFIFQYVLKVVPAPHKYYGELHETNAHQLRITRQNTTKTLRKHLFCRSPLRFLKKLWWFAPHGK